MNVSFADVRERLERRREELLRRSRHVERDLNRMETPLSADLSEQAVEALNQSTLAAIGRAADAEIGEIDEALQRLNTGEYGICRACGRPIEARRLSVLPQSVRCATCWG